MWCIIICYVYCIITDYILLPVSYFLYVLKFYTVMESHSEIPVPLVPRRLKGVLGLKYENIYITLLFNTV